jgi:hypothetical protein
MLITRIGTRDATPHATFDSDTLTINLHGSTVEDSPATDHLPLKSLLTTWSGSGNNNHDQVMPSSSSPSLLSTSPSPSLPSSISTASSTMPTIETNELLPRWSSKIWSHDLCLNRCESSCAVINGYEIHIFGGHARDGGPIPGHVMFDGHKWIERLPIPNDDELRNGMASISYGLTICIGGGSFYKVFTIL